MLSSAAVDVGAVVPRISHVARVSLPVALESAQSIMAPQRVA
jgi:hypothetical protein